MFFADNFSTECRITMEFLHNFLYPEVIFNSKCKNQGYNENHICNISNFSKIHHQAERKKSLNKFERIDIFLSKEDIF